MTTQPLVSVIIPAYNAAAFIRETLESVLAQTHEQLEVIVVDDGSTDSTAQIVRAVAARDPRVVLLHQANGGVAAARNLAIAHSKGEFVAPIDADDVWFPQKIEKQLQRMQDAGPAVGFVYTSSVSIDEESLVIGVSPAGQIEGEVLRALVYRNFTGNASTPLIRRSCLDEVGGYDSELRAQGGQGCEDWDLALRCAAHCRFAVVPDYLVGYRRLTSSMSQNHGSMHKSYELVMAKVKHAHPEIPEKIFRWSKGYFYLYLSRGSYRGGDHQDALRWTFRALRLDPALLLSLGALKSTTLNVFWLGVPLLTPIMGRRWRERLDLKRRHGFKSRSKRPLTDLGMMDVKRTAWQQWTPHAQIFASRVREASDRVAQP